MCQSCHLIGRALATFADESARVEALRRDSSSAFLISRDCPENAATIGAVRAAAEQAIAQREADAARALGRTLVSACVQSIGDCSHRRAEFRHGASEVPHVRDDGGAGDIAGEDQRISRMVAGFLDGLASGFHESSSSVGGAAVAARVIGGSEQPTEEAPGSEEIDDSFQRVLAPLFSSIGEALMPVARALGEGIAASVVKAGHVSVAPLESSGQGVA